MTEHGHWKGRTGKDGGSKNPPCMRCKDRCACAQKENSTIYSRLLCNFYSVNQKSTQRFTIICSGRLSKRERKRGLDLVKQIVTKSVFFNVVINRHSTDAKFRINQKTEWSKWREFLLYQGVTTDTFRQLTREFRTSGLTAFFIRTTECIALWSDHRFWFILHKLQ
jgi:hypothetical protein